MTCLAANNASARLATSVTVEDLAIQLATGEGAMFPTPSANDYFMITVFEQTGDAFNMEIMKCTHREGDVLTVERAQEGTSATAFSVSGRVENRFTAGMYNAMGDEVRAIAQSVQQQLDSKQDTLTFDTTPTAGSSNPVTSDGIKNAIDSYIPESVPHADTAGSVAGISNPMSRDAGAGGIGSIVFGRGNGDIYPGGVVGRCSAITMYSSGEVRISYSQSYGGTWRNVGARVLSSAYITMWQRIA